MITEALYIGTGVTVCADDVTLGCIMILCATLMVSVCMWVLLLSTSPETSYNRSMNITKYIACVAFSTLSACVHVPAGSYEHASYSAPATYYTEYSYRARPVYPYSYYSRPAVTYREPYRVELHSRNWGSVDRWHSRYEGRP